MITRAELLAHQEHMDALRESFLREWDEKIATLTAELEALRKDKERLKTLANLVWRTRWVSQDSDYQDVVAIAAEIRSGNFTAINSAMEKEKSP